MTPMMKLPTALFVLLAACSAQAQTRGEAVHDTQRLYGIHVKATVLAATQRTGADGQAVTASLEILDAANSTDGSKVSGTVEVIVGSWDPNHGMDLKGIRPGANIQAFIDSPTIDRSTHTILPQATPYQASLVEPLSDARQ